MAASLGFVGPLSAQDLTTPPSPELQAPPEPAPVEPVVAPTPVKPKPRLRPKPVLVEGPAAEEEGDVYDPTAPGARPLPDAAQRAVVAPVIAPVPAAPVAPAPSLRSDVKPAAAVVSSASGDVPLTAFFGRFLGSGAEGAAGDVPGGKRMSQVQIAGSGSGFTVTWSTMKLGNNFKPEPVNAATQVLTFVPTETASLFRAADSGVLTSGQPAAWARIKGRTMTVVKMEMLPDGTYAVQHYDRTLTDNGMAVAFTRFENGQIVRTVKLDLGRAQSGLW